MELPDIVNDASSEETIVDKFKEIFSALVQLLWYI